MRYTEQTFIKITFCSEFIDFIWNFIRKNFKKKEPLGSAKYVHGFQKGIIYWTDKKNFKTPIRLAKSL